MLVIFFPFRMGMAAQSPARIQKKATLLDGLLFRFKYCLSKTYGMALAVNVTVDE